MQVAHRADNLFFWSTNQYRKDTAGAHRPPSSRLGEHKERGATSEPAIVDFLPEVTHGTGRRENNEATVLRPGHAVFLN